MRVGVGGGGFMGGVRSKSCGKNPLIGGTLPSINFCGRPSLPADSQE